MCKKFSVAAPQIHRFQVQRSLNQKRKTLWEEMPTEGIWFGISKKLYQDSVLSELIIKMYS